LLKVLPVFSSPEARRARIIRCGVLIVQIMKDVDFVVETLDEA